MNNAFYEKTLYIDVDRYIKLVKKMVLNML